MTGNAVETTRLSSDAMKRANPVMTMAHTGPPARARDDDLGASPPAPLPPVALMVEVMALPFRCAEWSMPLPEVVSNHSVRWA